MMSLLKRTPKPLWIAVLLAIALLAFAACGDDEEEGGPAATPTPAATATPVGEQTLDIAMVPTIQFDKAELTLKADGSVTVAADNTDTGIDHNFAVYTDESAQELIAKTEICVAPCEDSVTFDIPEPGEYFFRCDVHPGLMVGTFIVE